MTNSIATFEPTPRTKINRKPQRGSYDKAVVNAILDEGLICHIGFAVDEQPYVIPTAYCRVDEQLYIHGAPASRMLKTVREGINICLTVTLLDELVLARSAFNHSMNYRSVVVLGQATEVTDLDEKNLAMRALVEHIVPGRWEDSRQPTLKELKATLILVLPIEQVSAKIRSGPVIDDEDDYGLPYWAGLVPLPFSPGRPINDARLPDEVAAPAYALNYQRPVSAPES